MIENPSESSIGHLEEAFKKLWERITLASELIKKLQQEKNELRERIKILEDESNMLRNSIILKDQEIKRKKTEITQSSQTNGTICLTNEEKDALKSRIRDLISKINYHL